MTTEELQIKLTGDVSNFASSMRAATGALNTIAAGMQKTRAETAKTQASIESFTAAMTHAAEKTEFVGKQFKKLGHLGTEVATALGAALTGAFLGGAKYDPEVAKQLKTLQDIAGSLAAEVAGALMPAARELADWLRNVLGWVQGLNPQLKENIAHWATIALKAAAVVAVAGKIGGAFSDVAEFAAKIIIPLLPILPEMILILGAAVALAAAYGYVRESIDGAFGDSALSNLKQFGKALLLVAETLGGITSGNFGGAIISATNLASLVGNKNSGAFGGKNMADVVQQSFKRTLNDLASVGTDFGKKALAALGLGGLLESTGKPGKVHSSIADQKSAAEARKKANDHVTELAKKWETDEAAIYKQKEAIDLKVWKQGNDLIEKENTEAFAMAKRQIDHQHEMEKAAAEASERFKGAMLDAVMNFASKAGDAGKMANDAVSGFKSGGVWVMLANVILDIVAELKAGAEALKNASKGIRMMSRLLNELLGDMKPVTDLLLQASVKPLMLGVKTLGMSVLFLVKGIASFYNWVRQANEDFAAALTFRKANKIQGIDETGIDELYDRLKSMNDATYDRISAEDDAAEAAKDHAAQLNKITESLTNVPATFKIGAARLAAQDAGGGTSVFGNSTQGLSGAANKGKDVYYITINGDTYGEGGVEALAGSIEEILRRKRFQRNGGLGGA